MVVVSKVGGGGGGGGKKGVIGFCDNVGGKRWHETS